MPGALMPLCWAVTGLLSAGVLVTAAVPRWPVNVFNTVISPSRDPGGLQGFPSISLTPPSFNANPTSFSSSFATSSSSSSSSSPTVFGSTDGLGLPSALGTSTPVSDFTSRLLGAEIPTPTSFGAFTPISSEPIKRYPINLAPTLSFTANTVSSHGLNNSELLLSGSWGSSGSSRNGVSSSKVLSLAEDAARGAKKFFARTFRAFGGNPAETVKLELFTKQQSTSPTRIYARKRSSVENSTFDPRKPIKIIIHGFYSHQGPGTGGDWLKNAFLAVQDCNVVTVDWSGADPHEYNSAVALAVPRVGAEVAELIRLFNNMGANLNDVHIVGHSLGAQIAGAAGSQVLGPAGAGRITGLDPAGPLFTGRDPTNRLDPTDAGFVDIIHTDGGMLGTSAATGHVDFFPNGGTHVYPGCGRDLVGLCSHCLAYDFMLNGILQPGTNVYRGCSSWPEYQRGYCGSGDNAVMGIYTDPRSRGMYYLAADMPIRPELRKIGDGDPISLFSAKRENGGKDLVEILHC